MFSNDKIVSPCILMHTLFTEDDQSLMATILQEKPSLKKKKINKNEHTTTPPTKTPTQNPKPK